jgi:uncharacterized protein (TIGR00369 family)
MSASPSAFEPKATNFEARCRDSFARQPYMTHLGCELVAIRPGFAEIRMPFRPELRQQHGFFHGGAIASALDSAAGYAAFSLMPEDATVLTVEYKLNFMSPGEGEAILARGQVVKAGRTLSVVQADAYALRGGAETLIATSIQTLMSLAGRPDDARLGAGRARIAPGGRP